jgi:uncharacterized protein (TIGR03437 family)
MKYCRHFFITISILSCVPVTHAQVTLNPSATRAIGAARLEQLGSITNVQPNLVEGRELNTPEAIALDLSVNPPHLYIADTGNNRILGWKNATTFANGAFADIVIGQNDLFTTLAQGPGRSGSTLQSSGMAAPMGMAVDGGGNLYVIDAGNNRILRFPAPFNQTSGQLPNMVIGQQNFLSNAPNSGGVSASTLAFSNSSNVFQAYMKFDSSGNLWVADVVNQRVLEFQASDLAAGKNGPNAVLVLGQPDFSTNSITTPYDPTSTSVLNYPTGIAFDQSGGRLYVSESQPGSATSAVASTVRSRVLVFQPPYATNKPAQRIIGTVASTNPVQPPTISAEQFSYGTGDNFAINDNIAVADTNNNRILVFPSFLQYTSDTLTQNAQVVIGQGDFNSGQANRGNADANSNSLRSPADAAFAPGASSTAADSAGEVYITDTGNNRVIVVPVIPNSSTLGFNNAVRLLGQQQFSEQAPNYIEGREFHFSDNSGEADVGIALDINSNPPHLYVADTYNNRILCYVDYRTVTTGSTATFVIGQPDLFHADVNYPSGTANTLNQGGLNHPTGLAVDPATGNLYVADSGNGRVLRFPAPFLQPSNVNQTPDIVLGQANFTTKITDVSASRMAAPYGIAFVPSVGLLVADALDDRVLLFPGTNFVSGMAATKVWGQASFTTANSGSTSVDNRLSSPHGIAVDSGQRLYVVDSGNNRVLVFDNITAAGTDPHSIISIAGLVGGALNSPRSIFITPQNVPLVPADQIWIGDTSRALRFSGGYASLFTSGVNGTGFTPDAVISEAGALGLAIDGYGALYVADDINRVVIHYIALAALNGASYITSRSTLAPNTIVSLFSEGGTFGAGTQTFSTLPLPTTMQAIQVQMNGTPLPLYYVSPAQINLLIPNNAPTSGTADLQVVRTDNGQVLGDTTITMGTDAPGVFSADGSGKGQVAALNQDNTANSSSNPIARGSVLQIYGTGVGFISGAPNNGSAVTGATPSPQTATAYIGGIQCPVQYSGLAPGLVGVWQINIQVSQNVVPTSSAPGHISELIILQDGTAASSASLYGIQDTVWVK